MTKKKVIIRLTPEQARLLMDNFSQSFWSELPGNEELDVISQVLNDSYGRAVRKT